MQWPVKKRNKPWFWRSAPLILAYSLLLHPPSQAAWRNSFPVWLYLPSEPSGIIKKILVDKYATSRQQAREWIFHVTKHISRTYWLECAFLAVIGDKHERGGHCSALNSPCSTESSNRHYTVIACSARAWAEPQLGPCYWLCSKPKHLPAIPGNFNISLQPGNVINTV